ncbi:MAG: CBS domain-containing protein [Actinobacteria bacterium]|nr:CBS domain-containing protein [Actinomycetota bacterium]
MTDEQLPGESLRAAAEPTSADIYMTHLLVTRAVDRWSTDPGERRRIRDLGDLLDAETALYEQATAALERGDRDTAEALLRTCAGMGIGDAQELLDELLRSADPDPGSGNATPPGDGNDVGTPAAVSVMGSAAGSLAHESRALHSALWTGTPDPGRDAALFAPPRADCALTHLLVSGLPPGTDHCTRELAALAGLVRLGRLAETGEPPLLLRFDREGRGGDLARLLRAGRILLVFNDPTAPADVQINAVRQALAGRISPPAQWRDASQTAEAAALLAYSMMGNGWGDTPHEATVPAASAPSPPRTAADVLVPYPIPELSPDDPIDTAVERMLADSEQALPVLEGGWVSGIVTLADAVAHDRDNAGRRPVNTIARPARHATSDTPIDTVRDLLISDSTGLLPVIGTDGTRAGYISPRTALAAHTAQTDPPATHHRPDSGLLTSPLAVAPIIGMLSG